MIKSTKPGQADFIFSSPGDVSKNFAKDRQVFSGKSHNNEGYPQGYPRWNEYNTVKIEAGPVGLHGILNTPATPTGVVVFVDGTSESRGFSSNKKFASHLHSAGLATLLFNLLTAEEVEMDGLTTHLSADVGLMARRTIGTLDWLSRQPVIGALKLGCFGAGSGTAAALIAAAERPEITSTVVLRGGLPDFIDSTLPRVKVPVLLMVAEHDPQAKKINPQAVRQMNGSVPKEVCVIPGASSNFDEPLASEIVTHTARDWFQAHLGKSA